MESISKLIVITSANNPEYANYWGANEWELENHAEHEIIKDGQTRGKWKVFSLEDEELKQKLQKNIDENCLIMIHLHKRQNNFQEMEFKKGGKRINCFIYYYSKQDPLLNKVLWTIGDDYIYQGGVDPQSPFDKLRMSIVKNDEERTKESVEGIIKWVKKKTSTQNLLNQKLDLLHRCLNQGTAPNEIKEMPDFDDVKDIEVEKSVSVDDFINNHLLEAKPTEYNNQLIILRDALLKEEEFGSV